MNLWVSIVALFLFKKKMMATYPNLHLRWVAIMRLREKKFVGGG